ncbi:hypothetical protein ANANG_G00062290 [Anguilla anguilla]|uniref:B-cell lymphoma 9 beta-catenin binding domain-containing protein n=1 Tax=Anguilla anguilla TaxID=7936 RepID=A0A9D3MRA5_ANGAN|nr:hypothetical protein ANANG_G00062290 [Anguilla anguilla]
MENSRCQEVFSIQQLFVPAAKYLTCAEQSGGVPPERSESRAPPAAAAAGPPPRPEPPGLQSPADAGAQAGRPAPGRASAAGVDSKGSSPRNTATPQDGGPPSGTPGPQQPAFPSLEGLPKGADAKMTAQHHQQLANEIMSSMGDNPEGLSQEQLEHRERSLQTLRDIQRMLFPDDKDTPRPCPQPRHDGGPQEARPGAPAGHDGPVSEPGQAQPGPRPDGPPSAPSHRDMPFSPDELGPPPPGRGRSLGIT